jgi:sulfate transport system ATP-binding protein
LHDEIHLTSVFVTHDQEEALEVSDQVVVMSQGNIEQVGTPESVYDHPATPFVANFLGSVNLFHGRVEDGQLHLGEHQVGAADGNDGKAVAFVRPHEFELVPGWAERDGLPATIVRVVSVGPSAQIELSRSDGELVEVSIARDSFRLLGLGKGDQVLLRPRHIRVFQAEAQAA